MRSPAVYPPILLEPLLSQLPLGLSRVSLNLTAFQFRQPFTAVTVPPLLNGHHHLQGDSPQRQTVPSNHSPIGFSRLPGTRIAFQSTQPFAVATPRKANPS